MSKTSRPVVNAASVEAATGSGSPSGFQTRYRQLGPLFGGELLGATLYEFDPGERTGPYHYEVGNEECALVLAGTTTLRRPHGRDVLEVGDLVMLLGCAYPDSGKVSTFGGDFRMGSRVDYCNGESAD